MDAVGLCGRHCDAISRLLLYLLTLTTMGMVGCGPSTSDSAERRPEQAGQPVDPVALAGHIAAARVSAAQGDTTAAETHVRAIANDVLRSARVYDPSRPIDHEAARAAVSPVAGVRSAIWLDHENLVVMVDGQQHRSMAMIDQVCLALEPLGDTLAVVVNLQDATAKNGDEAETLSRNCQLADGQRAFMQRKRQVDVVAPELRKRFKEMQRH